MYSGLLPKGLSEADVSSEEEEDSRLTAHSHGTDPDCRPLSPQVSNLPYQAEPGSSSASGQDDCLPGVTPQLWQKFKDLQQEREVQKLDQPYRKRKRKTWHHKDKTEDKDGDTEYKREHEEKRGRHWEELTQYFGANERFQPPACSRPPLKSGLEKSMESAIAEGDYAKAEELSDRLATRELAVKIAEAADCRDFAHKRRQEEASQNARKKRKHLTWGFEAKKRWETKSNMGYM